MTEQEIIELAKEITDIYMYAESFNNKEYTSIKEYTKDIQKIIKAHTTN